MQHRIHCISSNNTTAPSIPHFVRVGTIINYDFPWKKEVSFGSVVAIIVLLPLQNGVHMFETGERTSKTNAKVLAKRANAVAVFPWRMRRKEYVL